MLCWSAKWLGQRKVHFYDESGDMLTPLWKLLDEADAVVHYNGQSFDVPHINREFLLADMGPPSSYFQIDLYRTVASQFKFMSNKLGEVARRLGLGEKDDGANFDLWKECMAGDEAAWRRMRRYNVQDVRLTEALYNELRPWIKGHPSMNLVTGDKHSCPTCGSADIIKRGFYRTKISAYQQWQCKDCGSYSRAGKRLDAVDLRAV